jgi:uncharacterized protein YecE (DUF72 family)
MDADLEKVFRAWEQWDTAIEVRHKAVYRRRFEQARDHFLRCKGLKMTPEQFIVHGKIGYRRWLSRPH